MLSVLHSGAKPLTSYQVHEQLDGRISLAAVQDALRDLEGRGQIRVHHIDPERGPAYEL